MQAVRVMLVDDHAFQRDQLAAALNLHEQLQVVHAAGNGMDALHAIEHLHPDAVIFDLVLPQLDGFGLLERVQRMEAAKRPVMIVLTSLGRDDFVARAMQLGASDYLVKPQDLTLLGDRVLSLVRHGGDAVPPQQASAPIPAAVKPADPVLASDSMMKYATMLLMQLGMPAHLSGYQYILEAILLTVQQPAMITHMTGELYPLVAQRCDSTPSRVERSIRNAIAIAWERTGGQTFQKLLGRTGECSIVKPANSELIAQLAARVRMHG